MTGSTRRGTRAGRAATNVARRAAGKAQADVTVEFVAGLPAGIAAANLLGFTTQTGKRGEVATSAGSLPRKLMGVETVIHTRRPEAWADLRIRAR